MKKIQDLNWFELWSDGEEFRVYDPTHPVYSCRSRKAALEWIAAHPDPKRGKDHGPIRHARHIAKCLLAQEAA
jgi:hypothetical protein